MKIAVIGNCSFTDYKQLKLILDEIKDISLIVSGGAKGADMLGEVYANENNIPTKILVPNWKKYGKVAGFIRNKDIIAETEFLLFFWDGISSGTKHSIDLAKKLGLPCKVVVVVK